MSYKAIFAAGLMAAAVSSPALAQDADESFTGGRVSVELGVVGDDFASTDKGTYGLVAGYDFDLGGAVVGVEGSYTGLFDDDGTDLRDLSIAARVGGKVSPRTLVYGKVGYSNLDADLLPGSVDGVVFGLGLEQSFGALFGTIETRYSNYQFGLETYQTVVGVGVRF